MLVPIFAGMVLQRRALLVIFVLQCIALVTVFRWNRHGHGMYGSDELKSVRKRRFHPRSAHPRSAQIETLRTSRDFSRTMANLKRSLAASKVGATFASKRLLYGQVDDIQGIVGKDLDNIRKQVNYASLPMSKSEINLITRYLQGAKTYLEWGSGENTLNFGKFASIRAVSIENRKNLCDSMPGRLRTERLDRKVEFYCIVRQEEDSQAHLKTQDHYLNKIEFLDQATWDFVLVDGRSQIRCALKALSYLHSKSVVLFRNLKLESKNYRGYRRLLSYFDVIERAGGVVVLRRKRLMHWMEGNHAEVQRIVNGARF